MSISNVGAANLLRNKNDQIQQARQQTADTQAGLIGVIAELKRDFDALSARNQRLENLLLGITKQGTANKALGTIHVLKAQALQRKADNEGWSIEQRREANLRLAAEAEYDYRIKNDLSYRLNAAADSLMKVAEHSENGDEIRKVVQQMYATGKIHKDEEREQMINQRIGEMRLTAHYASDRDVLPLYQTILPAKLESDENDKEEYNSFSQIAAEAKKEPAFEAFIR